MTTTNLNLRTIGDSEDPYDWAFRTDRKRNKDKPPTMVRLIDEVQSEISNFKETRTTFKTRDVTDGDRCGPYIRDIIRHFGAWPAPDHYYKNRDMWVNPHAKWAPKFSDVAVRCDCGAMRYTPEFRADANSLYLEDKYSEPCADDCPADDRYATKKAIWDNRRRIIEHAVINCIPPKRLAPRLDVTPSRVKSLARNFGFDWMDAISVGYRKRRATWQKMNEQGVKHAEIAEAWGLCRQTISDHIRGERDYYQEAQV